MKMKFLILTTVVTLTFLAPPADGYGGGAPTSKPICDSMVPGHGEDPQTSAVPYTIKLDKNSVDGGDKVKVTLSSLPENGKPFKGFLVMGRNKDFKKDKKSQGKFTGEIKNGPSSVELAQITDCSDVKASSMTHTNAGAKQQVVVEWEAPNVDGEFVIVATFVENGATYWVENPSETIKVKRNANFQAEAVTEKPATTPSPAAQGLLSSLYKDCGDPTADIPKGCFGLPNDCIESNNCELFVTYRMDGENGARFQLAGRAPSYVAVGLSKDAHMGEDSVFGCRVDGSSVVVGEYWNPGKSNEGVVRNKSLISNSRGSFVDGYITCEFNVNGVIEIPSTAHKFDLVNDKFHILLSRGTNSAKDYLNKHQTSADRGAAPNSIHLSDTGILVGSSPIYVQLHGSLMIVAWLLCASSGMFTARYYKQTHTDTKPCGVAFWFVLHRFFMTLTVLMTIAAFILIFIEVGGYTENPSEKDAEKYHPILGIVLTCLAILQVLIAFCRPMPNAKHRYLFNWVHWIIGNAAHIVGIACIFLANDLSKANLQNQSRYWGLLAGFVAFHVLLHIIMSIHTLRADRQMEIQNKKRAVLPGPMKLSGLDAEAPGTGFRTAILTVYILGAGATAGGLVYFVIDSLQM